MNPGANRRGSNEEIVLGEMGQMGTQFDGIRYQTIGDSLYTALSWMSRHPEWL